MATAAAIAAEDVGVRVGNVLLIQIAFFEDVAPAPPSEQAIEANIENRPSHTRNVVWERLRR